MLQTRLCDVLKIEIPIIQAPIGSASNPQLAAAVSDAGGLGTISITWRSKKEIIDLVQNIKLFTDKPFAVNIAIAWNEKANPETLIDLAIELDVPIISLFWGDATPYIEKIKAAGRKTLVTVGSAAEASKVVAAGADVLVGQGVEAGGHVTGNVSTMVLVPAIVDIAGTTPVVAAGGIADGRAMAAALALGASGVWMGTRFLLSNEALTHPIYQSFLLEAAETDTYYSELFDIGWPNAPHRVLTNSTVRNWLLAGQPPSGHRPGEGEVIAQYKDGRNILRYEDTTPTVSISGEIEAMALYAGQSVGLICDCKSAKDILASMVQETEQALKNLHTYI